MRVLLIGFEPYFAAIGIRYLSSYVRNAGYDPYVLILPKPRPAYKRPFLETEDEKRAIVSFARDLDIGVVGMSLMTHHFARAKALTRAFRGGLSAPVVWGGVHAGSVPGECAAEADFVCLGEGEVALADFLRRLDSGRDLFDARGFAYSADGELVENPLGEIIKDLDEIPLIETDKDRIFFLERGRVVQLNAAIYRKYSTHYGTWYRLTTARGCPYRCAYCAIPTKKVRRRSVSNVMEEVGLVMDRFPFTRVLNIQDDSFILADDEWLAGFARRLRSEFGLEFACRLMPTSVTDERIKVLYDGGLRYVSVGLESGSDRVNREVYRRPATANDFLRADRIIGRYDIYKEYDVIVDNPYERDSETVETVRTLARAGKPFALGVYSLTPYPATAFYDRAKADRKLAVMTDPYESPFQVTRPGLYRTPNHLLELIYCTILFPSRLVMYLAAASERRRVKVAIDLLFKLHQRIIGRLYAFRRNAPAFFAAAAKAVRLVARKRASAGVERYE